MADAYHHAQSSAKKWGGVAEDYLPVHNWFDETKRFFADPRHRAIRHHSQGIGWAIDYFGPTVTLSVCAKCGETEAAHRYPATGPIPESGHPFRAKEIPTRWVGEQHCYEDFGRIPTMDEWLREMKVEKWMVRGARPLSRELEGAST